MTDRIVLLDKTYDGESVVDAFRDTSEAFVADFTPSVKDIPTDEHGFQRGTFRVLIEWLADGVTGTPARARPLTIAQINALPESRGSWPMSMNNRIIRLIRAVERAHGIGVAPTALALPRRGLVVLKNVIQLLREEARFVDEEGDDTNALEELLEALCADGVAPTSQPGELYAILEFLYGAAPLDGCWFGHDRHPPGHGRYWWRSRLRAALTAAGVKEDGNV